MAKKKLTNNTGIPQEEIELIARVLLPEIVAFYESAAGQAQYAEWVKNRETAEVKQEPENN